MWPTVNKSVKRKAPSFKRGANGVTKIKRDGYSTVNGFSVANAWWDINAAVLKRDNNQCVPCKRAGRLVRAQEVHHISKLGGGGRTTMANLMSVCKTCHDKRHAHLFRSRR